MLFKNDRNIRSRLARRSVFYGTSRIWGPVSRVPRRPLTRRDANCPVFGALNVFLIMTYRK